MRIKTHEPWEFTPPLCGIEGWGAAIAGASLLGGVVGAAGSIAGAGEQAGASEQATQAQEAMFQQQEGNLAPYQQGGVGALNQLNYLEGNGPSTGITSNAGGYGSLNAPFTAQTMQQYSPAYQFQMQQGQQGVLNTDSSGQGALSGAALKDLTGYNQSYANTAFNNAFNQYQTQNQNVYGRLAGIANLGEAASANSATGGSNYAQGIGQSLTNTGTALASGISGLSSNLSTGLLGALNQGNTYNPNNDQSAATYYTADGTPYQGTVGSGGFGS